MLSPAYLLLESSDAYRVNGSPLLSRFTDYTDEGDIENLAIDSVAVEFTWVDHEGDLFEEHISVHDLLTAFIDGHIIRVMDGDEVIIIECFKLTPNVR